FANLKSLSILDVSYNQLTELPDGIYELEHLAEIRASNNQIMTIDANVSKLTALKVLSLNVNKIEIIPAELSECHKLKDLHLQDNSIKDSRLVKLIKQCHTKAVLDYIATGNEKGKVGKKGGKKGRKKRVSEGDTEEHDEQADTGPVVTVLCSEDYKIFVQASVLDIRPYIVCTLVRNLDLADVAIFKKFINIQTKLHESVCDHRTLATIATHDASSLAFPLKYEASNPADIHLTPLGRHKEITAEQTHIRPQADAMKHKQKTKRNPFKTGLYKYLSLVEGAQLYAVIRDSTEAVLSLPPVTNSERSKITAKKLDVLLEVTSPINLGTCKSVMDSLISKMLEVGLYSKAEPGETAASDVACPELVIEQVRVVNSDGQLKVVYPSRVDLQLESVKVIHQEKE
ncbi:RNA binding, partial [Desmophyllum pertusum]